MNAAPFVIRRSVKWGEADPAGIVYTPRFLDWCVEAAEKFFVEVVGAHWYELDKRGMGSPVVHASLDFEKPLWAAEPFELVLTVAELGRSTLTYRIVGRRLDGERCFTAKLVSAMIDVRKMKAIRIPDEYRARIEAFRQAQSAAAPA